ncbi:MAG TPA: MotA/TolQ/ExbB proton channel family protein [Chthoniobacterales bacterium]
MSQPRGLDLSAVSDAAMAGLDTLWAKPKRSFTLLLFALAGVVFIILLSLILSGRAAVLVLDKPSTHFVYPFTIQNLMHIIFFVGLGDLFIRWRIATREKKFLGLKYLPEDDQTVLVSEDLGPIRKRVAGEFDYENGFLPSLINIAMLQFQSSSSVEQAAGVMNQNLELMSHRLDLRYGLVRFIAWVVPTLGFIGTVYALGASLSQAGLSDTLDLKVVARTLGIGFDCTMVALVESAILVFILHLVQEKEESTLNNAGDYTLRNLINRLYVDES